MGYKCIQPQEAFCEYCDMDKSKQKKIDKLITRNFSRSKWQIAMFDIASATAFSKGGKNIVFWSSTNLQKGNGVSS